MFTIGVSVNFTYSKINQINCALIRFSSHQNILRLEVSMDNSSNVYSLEDLNKLD